MKIRVAMVTVAILSNLLFAVAQAASPDSSVPAGTITGRGTAHYIPVFTGPTTIRNSTIFETSDASVGINTNTPGATLDVNGAVNAATSFNLGGSPFAFGSMTNANAFLGFAGNSATTGAQNTAVGFGALLSNSTGSGNTASGYNALAANTASYNTASGFGALLSNTTGPGNTASGSSALYYNTTGGENTASGDGALYRNTTGFDNTASGFVALLSNTTGSGNTACGTYALYYTTGSENTASGHLALFSNTTGNDNTAVGHGADVGSGNLTNATAIGAYASVSQSNSLVLGGTGGYAVRVGISTAAPSNIFTIAQSAGSAIADGWDTYSSRRWKTNIQTLPDALAKVERLRGVSYDLKQSGKHEIGVVAEEVGKVVPELVSYEENGKDARGVDYSRLTALLIEATKEQQRDIRHEHAELAKVLRHVRNLEAEVRETRETLRKVTAQVAAAQSTLVAAK